MYPRPEINALRGSIIDSHAHYNDERFEGFRDELLLKMEERGVKKIINCGTDYERIEQVLELSKKYDFCYTAIGFHPSHVPDDWDIDYARLDRIIKSEDKINAIKILFFLFFIFISYKTSRIDYRQKYLLSSINFIKKRGKP